MTDTSAVVVADDDVSSVVVVDAVVSAALVVVSLSDTAGAGVPVLIS